MKFKLFLISILSFCSSYAQGQTLVFEDFATDTGVVVGGGGATLVASGGIGELSGNGTATFINASTDIDDSIFLLGGEVTFTVDLVGAGADFDGSTRFLQLGIDGNGNVASGAFGAINVASPETLTLNFTLDANLTDTLTPLFLVTNGFGGNPVVDGQVALIDNFTVEFVANSTAVPEPSSACLALIGCVFVAVRRKR